MGRGLSRVLIVGGDVGTREALAECIASFELAVTTAPDAREGLDQARHGRPDVILLDFQTLGEEGIGLLAQLRSDPALAQVGVVALGAGQLTGMPVQASLPAFDLNELARVLRRLGREPQAA